MSLWATDGEEKDKLKELASAEGTDLYFDYCVREKRNYVDILEDFRSCHGNISIGQLIDAIPVLKPRAYSIASAPSEEINRISICVVKTVDTTRRGRKRAGTCSSFLCSFANTVAIRPVYLWIKSGIFGDAFRSLALKKGLSCVVPALSQILVPLLLVGPGTGVAPMRSIVRDFFHRDLFNANPNELSSIPVRLFFGCRRKDCDFLYESEWGNIVSQCKAEEQVASLHEDYSSRLGSPTKGCISFINKLVKINISYICIFR
jgi:sulfite reductase alpha subunit-like flavoprotein